MNKKNDHKVIGKNLNIFTFSEKVGLGLPIWLHNGVILRNILKKYLDRIQQLENYEMVLTPHIAYKELYVTSGHWQKYEKESFLPIKTPNKEEFILKPMNCPHHCEIYRINQWSYRDLPKRFAEFGTVYRYEQSGELNGLTRTRCFTQDDAHIFCTYDQLLDEFKSVIDLVLKIFNKVGFNNFEAQISLRDVNNTKKYIGNNLNWEKSEESIIRAAKEKKLNTKIIYGEAAFYGPKLDFMVKDSLGRKWQLGTIQVDYNLPERFDLKYRDIDNKLRRPIMIHRAPFGSLERFIALLLENTSGNLPLWLSPYQVVIVTISKKYIDYGINVLNLLSQSEIRVFLDKRNERVGKKIRDAELKKIPFIIVLGENEKEKNIISVREHGINDYNYFSIENFIKFFNLKIKNV